VEISEFRILYSNYRLYKSSAVAEMGDRLATVAMGRKFRGMSLLGEAGPHLTQSRLAEAYLHTKWHLHPSSRVATTDMGRKLGAVPI